MSQTKTVHTSQTGRTEVRPVRFAMAMLAAVAILCALLAVSACSGGQEGSQGSGGAAGTSGASTEPKTADDWVGGLLAQMSLEEKVAQLFIIHPEDLTGYSEVTEAGDATRRALRTYPVGGLIYYQNNLTGEEQTRALLSNTQTMAREESGIPIFLCVDEEGGQICRIGDKPGYAIGNPGSAQSIGETGDPEKARAVGKKIGTYLADLGFNVDFAPVADVLSVDGAFMGSRSFGSDADLVASMVAAEIEGFAQTSTLCCAKHFPGLGSARNNTDFEVAETMRTMDEFRAMDLKPFQSAVDSGVPIVMMGHIITPGTVDSGLPASLNAQWISILRDEMGFDGIIVTDSLATPVIMNLYTDDRVGVEVLLAGNDIILTPLDFEAAYNGILDAVTSGELSEERIDESVARILRAKYPLLG